LVIVLRFELAYEVDRKISVQIPDENLLAVIKPREIPKLANAERKIREAISQPIKGNTISKIAEREHKVVIIVTDISRPCPDEKLVPAILEQLRYADVRDNQVSVVVATGMHRPMTRQELMTKLSEGVCERVEAINHVCTDSQNLKLIGETPNLRIPIWVNRIVLEADTVISTGMVDPHIFAGYTGGGKSVMPGVSGLQTIESMHRPEWLERPFVGICSVDHNPVRLDIDWAARRVGLRFAVNVVLNSEGEIAQVRAGDPTAVQRELAGIVDGVIRAPITELPDIVIAVPGYPKNRDLYQATRAANNFVLGPTPAVRKGGVIIVPAPCQDGTGSEIFYKWMRDAKDLDEIIERGRREMDAGSHRAYIMAKILKRADVIIVGSRIPSTVEDMKMVAAETIEEALEMSMKKMGDKAKILVSPHGLTTVPVLASEMKS